MHSIQQAATGEIQTHPTDKENCMVCEIHMLNSHHTLFIQEKVSKTSQWSDLVSFRCDIDDTYPVLVTGED